MKLSVLIPAHDEKSCLEATVSDLVETLNREHVSHEILIVNDNSSDETLELCQDLASKFESVRYVSNQPPNGFGLAVRLGLRKFRGDAVAIVMADGSDDPLDVVSCLSWKPQSCAERLAARRLKSRKTSKAGPQMSRYSSLIAARS